MHGSGQGALDSPARWIMVSNGITLGFTQARELYEINDPTKTISISTSAKSFIDDTTIVLDAGIGEELRTFAQTLEINLALLEGLVKAAGGILNITKSSVVLFWWTFDADGDPHLALIAEAKINIQSQYSHEFLRQRKPTETSRILGAYPTPTGDTTKQ